MRRHGFLTFIILWHLAGGPRAAAAGGGERPVTDEDRRFWAFRKLDRPAEPPALVGAGRARTPVDAFILAKLRDAGLTLSPEADRATLLRRASLDLLGLPPSPEEFDRFLSDPSPDAYQRLLDRLFASPHFGERWGRHWLDAAGYVDVPGGDNDAGTIKPAPGKWRYRDYVVASFNADKPFDRFLEEQLAGDEVTDWRAAAKYTRETGDLLVATGFLRCSADDTDENELNTPDLRHGVLARTVEIVTQNLLALTIQCARCHAHKYDPLPQEDYYRLTAIFAPAFNPEAWRQPKDRALPDISAAEVAAIERENAPVTARIGELKKRIDELRKSAGNAGASPEREKEASALEREAGELAKRLRGWGTIQAVYDVGPPPETRLLLRGDHLTPGPVVEPGFPAVLCESARDASPGPLAPAGRSSGRRLALARWLTRPDTPASSLVARVQVNRAWQHLFGRGLVETTDNFGRSGAVPTHPELLEWLAARFVEEGFRLKPILKLLMTSSVYRQASKSCAPPSAAEAGGAGIDPETVDPSNRLLWRMPLRRLESETVRDSILVASGSLERKLGGPPVPLENLPDGMVVVKAEGPDPGAGQRRSLYLLARRNYHPSLLGAFDQPVVSTQCSCRTPSAVVSQSLTMMNDAWVIKEAERFADRVSRLAAGAPIEEEIASAFKIAFSRPPSSSEVAWCRDLLFRQTDSAEGAPAGKVSRKALALLCHALFNASEFLYVP